MREKIRALFSIVCALNFLNQNKKPLFSERLLDLNNQLF